MGHYAKFGLFELFDQLIAFSLQPQEPALYL